jgi:transcriptional regulator with PAS, ATPase and Fis domain
MVAAGEFRADLYYRLNVITLRTPPLRERLDEIQPLAEYLLEEIARRHGMPPCEIGPTALERLRRHDWPGNVRELSNVLERAVLMSDTIVLQAADIERVLPAGRGVPPAGAPLAFAETVAGAEREAIRNALRSTQGNKSQAAKLLGISRAALYEKIAVLGLDVPAV